MNNKEIAAAFSNGKFEKVYANLSDAIVWKVVEENVFNGKTEVVQQCEQVAAYFRSVETNFVTQHIVGEDQIVVVTGTAEFIRNKQPISFVSACDVYEFNDENQIKYITSYCIPRK